MKLLVVALALLLPAFAGAATINNSSSINLSNGLVGWWTFDGKDTNWATGKTNDLSGRGNTGQLISMSTSTSPVPGKIGQALDLGSTQNSHYIKVPSLTGLGTTNTATISAWVYSTANQLGYTGIIDARFSGEQGLIVNGVTNQLSFDWNATSPEYSSTSGLIIPNNKWTFVAVAFATTTTTLYMNGQSYTQNINNTARNENGDWYLGVDSSLPTTRKWQGKIDDVRIYNRALSAAEVSALYKQGAANVNHSNTVALTSGLIGYWTFDGKDTNWATGKANDVSGGGLNGTFVSMSTTTSPVAGKIGQGLYFNATTSYTNNLPASSPSYITNTTANSSIANLTKVSISVWIKPMAGPSPFNFSLPIFTCTNSDGNTSNNGIRLDGNEWSGTSGLRFTVGTVGAIRGLMVVSNNITKNVWQHVVVTWDGGLTASNIKYYINGNLSTTNLLVANDGGAYAPCGISPSGSFFIGRGGSSYDNTRFSGNMDDVRIYNRALSAAEVSALYKQGAANVNHSIASISKGLVGYWTFDGKDTNWATGKTNDLSGQGNTGTLVSMSTSTSPVTGKIGQGFYFNGTGSTAINIPDASIFTSSNVRTVSLWFKRRVLTTNLPRLITEESDTSNYWIIGIGQAGQPHPDAIQVNMVVGGARVETQTPDNSVNVAGKWYHVVAVMNGAQATAIYINGVSQSLGTATSGLGAVGTFKFSIGNRTDGLRPFDGTIDDVRIYNRALSAGEVKQLYNQTR